MGLSFTVLLYYWVIRSSSVSRQCNSTKIKQVNRCFNNSGDGAILADSNKSMRQWLHFGLAKKMNPSFPGFDRFHVSCVRPIHFWKGADAVCNAHLLFEIKYRYVFSFGVHQLYYYWLARAVYFAEPPLYLHAQLPEDFWRFALSGFWLCSFTILRDSWNMVPGHSPAC